MNARFKIAETPTDSEYGICSHCNSVEHKDDLDQSAYGETFVGEVLMLVGPNASAICNTCITEFAECAHCDNALKEDGAAEDAYGDKICESCSGAPVDEGYAELREWHHRRVL